MQYNFVNQGYNTGTLESPLHYQFGTFQPLFGTDFHTFTFQSGYTPSNVFAVYVEPVTTTYELRPDPWPDSGVIWNFNFRNERFTVEFTSGIAVVNPEANYPIYKFTGEFCRSSTESWDFDFTKQAQFESLADENVYTFVHGCDPYAPDGTFNFNAGCFGEPCGGEVGETYVTSMNTFTNNSIGGFVGELKPFFAAQLSSSSADSNGYFNGYTPAVYSSTLNQNLASSTGSFQSFTSEDHTGNLDADTASSSGQFTGFTTEQYETQLDTTLSNSESLFIGSTSDEHFGDLQTSTANATSVFDGYLNPAGIGDLIGKTGDSLAHIDSTVSLPTFVQYLNTKFDIAMEHGTRLSIDADLQSDPIEVMGATICTAAELGTMISVETLLPVIEYKWYAHKVLMGRETSEPLALSVCTMIEGAEVFAATTCIDILKAENMPGHDIYFGAENISRFIGATTCSTQHDTATNFLGYNVVVVDMVGSYTPTNVFDITTGTPTKTFIIETSNIYSYEAATYSKFLSNSFCTQRVPTTRLEIHVCEAIEEASALPYGRYVPTDPPVEPIDPTPPETGVTISVPIKGLYKVINQYSAKLNDGSDVEFQSLSIKCDADSHSWSFTGTLAANQDRTVITPSTDGQPIELVVILNSYQWTLLIEGISTTRSFGSTAVSVSGRGITALLSDPYYGTTSITQSILLTNQQIAEGLIPFDWTLEWALPTWNVPSGTYSHADTTPVVALARHVANCGGMLVPDRTAKKFYAKKRYPVAPWNFGTVNADIIIPDSAIISLVEEPIGQFGYDGVYVHGTTGDGVVGLVRKAGTAGSRLVATQSNAMMVDSTALHTLGERVLAGEAPQPKVKRVTTFMDGSSVPLVSIGSLLQVIVDGKSTKGVVNSVTVSLTLDNDALSVTQQLGIGESTENTFSLLKALVPTSPLILGQLISTDGTNSKLNLINGGTLNARGTGTVGLNYYVMDDVIQSVAPSVTAVSDVIV